jgi:hypothetical protein
MITMSIELSSKSNLSVALATLNDRLSGIPVEKFFAMSNPITLAWGYAIATSYFDHNRIV